MDTYTYRTQDAETRTLREMTYLSRINDQRCDAGRILDAELRNHNRNFASMRRTADFRYLRAIGARNGAIVFCAVSRRIRKYFQYRVWMHEGPLNDQRTIIIADNNCRMKPHETKLYIFSLYDIWESTCWFYPINNNALCEIQIKSPTNNRIIRREKFEAVSKSVHTWCSVNSFD